jgi:hypothetical protein
MRFGTASATRPGYREPMPKVSPNLPVACAMAEAKYVDANPASLAGGYSPMDKRSFNTP